MAGPARQPNDRLAAGNGPSADRFAGEPEVIAGAPTLPVLRSEDVLAGHRAVEIVHAGVRYRLSVTSMGKLILTK